MMKAHQIDVDDASGLGNDWIFELKIDGSREFWIRDNLVSCRNVNHNIRYKHIFEALKNVNAILDGEVCLENSNVLELNKKENWDKAMYYVFDCLEYDGLDLKDKPLFERQEILKHILSNINNPSIRFIIQFESLRDGWDYIIKNDLEGLMAKRIDSRYETEAMKEYRSHNWLKIKNWKEGLDEIVGHNVGDTQKGSFKLSVGTNINCPDLETLGEYTQALREQKRIFAEFYYRFKSKNGFYSPILKRLVIVENPFQLFKLVKEQLDMGMISQEEFHRRIEIEHGNV